MTEPPEDRPQEKSPPNINHVPSVLKHRTRIALAFITLCACTGLILFTGPGFPLAQYLDASLFELEVVRRQPHQFADANTCTVE